MTFRMVTEFRFNSWQEAASQGAESQESLPYASQGGSQGGAQSQQYATQETPLSEESGVAFGPVVHTS